MVTRLVCGTWVCKWVRSTLARGIRVLLVAIVAPRNKLCAWVSFLIASPGPEAKVCIHASTAASSWFNPSQLDLLLHFDHVVELLGSMVFPIDSERGLDRLRAHLEHILRHPGRQPTVIHNPLFPRIVRI